MNPQASFSTRYDGDIFSYRNMLELIRSSTPISSSRFSDLFHLVKSDYAIQRDLVKKKRSMERCWYNNIDPPKHRTMICVYFQHLLHYIDGNSIRNAERQATVDYFDKILREKGTMPQERLLIETFCLKNPEKH